MNLDGLNQKTIELVKELRLAKVPEDAIEQLVELLNKHNDFPGSRSGPVAPPPALLPGEYKVVVR